MGDTQIKQIVDLIPTIGIAGAILGAALYFGSRKLWVYTWVYLEMKVSYEAQLKDKDEQIQMWKERYDQLNDMWREINHINSRVADKALEKK